MDGEKVQMPKAAEFVEFLEFTELVEFVGWTRQLVRRRVDTKRRVEIT
jgi:hypothetical protein